MNDLTRVIEHVPGPIQPDPVGPTLAKWDDLISSSYARS